VVDLVAAADHKLLVLTPQLPSLHNAYALLKACVHRVVRRLAFDDVQQQLVDAALGHETKARTIAQLLSVLRPLDAAFTNRIVDTLLRFGVGIIGNQIESTADAGALSRMSPLIHDHLLVHAPLITSIPRSRQLAGGLRAGVATLTGSEAHGAVFRKLAQKLMQQDLDQLRGIERTQSQATQPLWVQLEVAADGRK
jgi:MinD-like ATPase involved in chromosome partitioning or flagellar assembly